MKKSFKRVLSLALCVILAFGVMGISAFAECTGIDAGEYTNLPYKCYTSIGDSVPWGYGLQDEDLDTGNVETVGMRVAGSYPDLIGKVLEENNDAVVHFASSSGSRLSDYRGLLEAALGYDNPYVHEGDAYGDRKSERAEVLFNLGPQLVQWLGESDLVTVQVGFNDITAALINTACACGLIDLKEIQNIEDASDALSYLVTALGNVEDGPTMLANIQTAFFREFAGIRQNIEAVVAEVEEASNKDADIIVMGYYDALAAFTVIPGTESMLFNMLNTVVASLNDCYSAAADKYDNVYYVSAPDAETFYAKGTTVKDLLSDPSHILLGIHPNAEGQEYIAKTVLASLSELNTCHHEHVKTMSQSTKCGKSWSVVDVKVCSDCGKVLSYGKVATPAATFDIPEQTINYVAKTVTAGISYIGAKLVARMSSLLGR